MRRNTVRAYPSIDGGIAFVYHKIEQSNPNIPPSPIQIRAARAEFVKRFGKPSPNKQ